MSEIVTEYLNYAVGAGAITAVLATLPGTLEIALVTAGAALRQKRHAACPPHDCRLAIVIPAHNEAALIGRCVASVRLAASASDSASIVVIADNCTDDTAARAASAGARVLTRRNLEQRGKGYALRMAFEQLQAEGFDAFLVIDADSVVTPNLVGETLSRLNAGAAATQCRYRVCADSASLRVRLMDIAFLAFNVLRPRGRSGWGLSAGILGNGFAVRRELLERVPYHAASIVEDLEYHLRLVLTGEHADFIDEATVYGEIPGGGPAARVQRSRWEGGRLRMAREWAPGLAAGIVRGQWHLIEALLDLVTLPLAYQVLLLCLLLALPGGFRLYAGLALGCVAAHVGAAAALGERPGRSLLTLLAAPFYILWKISTLDAVLAASRTGASWVRTDRGQGAGLKPTD